MTEIIYYIPSSGKSPIKKFIDSLPKPAKSKIFGLFENIEEYGISSIPQHCKKLRGFPFWKIKIVGKDNVRFFYIMPTESLIAILHGFVKKSQKTPVKEIQIALRRLRDWNFYNSKLDK